MIQRAAMLSLVLLGAFLALLAGLGALIWADHRNGKPVTWVQWATAIAVALLAIMVALPAWLEVRW